MKKKILLSVLALLVVIQFIRPARNTSVQANPNEIGLHYPMPDQVQAILKYSCYDCHSNNTVYPWYANVQPIGWLIQGDVNNAKHHLDFSDFGSYSTKKAKHKFEDIEDAATNGWMPLKSYIWLHKDAQLTLEQSKLVASWAAGLK
jgi:hypothetical protein